MLTSEDIRTLLLDKRSHILREQRFFQFISLFVCSGLLLYLGVTAILRFGDPLFVSLNTVIILILIPLALSSFYTFQRLHSDVEGNGNFKIYLQTKVAHIERLVRYFLWQSLFIILFVGLLELSIHAFFSHAAMSTLFADEESCWSLAAGFCAGSLTALIGARVLTKHLRDNLARLSSILKDLDNGQN